MLLCDFAQRRIFPHAFHVSIESTPVESARLARAKEAGMSKSVSVRGLIVIGVWMFSVTVAAAQGANNAPKSGCSALPSWSELRAALVAAVAQNNGFLHNHMWGTVVD